MGFWIRLRVEGLNIDRQFGKMVKSGVVARDVRRVNNKMLEMTVPSCQRGNAVAFFPPECYNVSVIGEKGFAKAVAFAVKRPALIILTVIFAVCLYVLGGYVWRVDVDAGEYRQEVTDVLRQNGLWIGAKASSVNLDEAENLICNSVPGIKYAVVSLEGSTLTVRTYKKETAAPSVDLSQPKSIYASSGGVVTRMVVVSGTPRVSVGDTVEKGQLLIEGVRTFADGTTEPTCAVGEVYAEVSSRGEAVFEMYSVQKVKTDEHKKFCFVSFLGYDGERVPAVYDCQIAERQSVTLFPLPIKITVVDVYRAEEQKTKLSFDSCRESLRQQALSAALLACGGKDASRVIYGEIKNDDGVIVTADIVSETRVDAYA